MIETEDNPGATQPSGFHSSPDNGPLIQTKQEEYKPQLPTYPNDRPSLEPRHSLGQLDHNQERKPSLSNKPEPEDPFNVGSTDRKRNLIMQRAQALLANFVPSFTVPTASSSAPDPMAGPVAGPSSAPMLSRSSTALAPPPAPTAVASPMTSDGRFNWATQAIFPPYGATATTAGMMGYNPMSLAPDSALGLHALPGLSWPYHAALNEDDEFNDELNLNQSFNGVMENLRGTVPTSQDRAEFTAAAAKAIEFQGSLGLAEACKTLGITNIKKLFLPGLAEDFMLMPHQ